nr:MAG TPA: hypothetical protein [Caudoviricetes sp.]
MLDSIKNAFFSEGNRISYIAIRYFARLATLAYAIAYS